MSRATNKAELLSSAREHYGKLNETIASLTEKELATPFDFSADEKKKEAHWKRDKNLRDVLIHLYEWHMLLLNCVEADKNGENKPFIPEPYNWKTYGDMNVALWKKHQKTSLEDAKKLLDKSHNDVLCLAEAFSDDELFTRGAFRWAGNNAMGSYFVSVTASHYDWAIKKLKAHKKNCTK